MKIEVYVRRYNEVMLYSDEFSVDCSLLNLFIREGRRQNQSNYIFNSGFTFKPFRVKYRIVPYFHIETGTIDILKFQDFRLENIYSDMAMVFACFDILDTRLLQSSDLPKYKSDTDFVKMHIIEVSREEFKKFILGVIDKVFTSCFFYIRRKFQFKQLYIFRSWLYNYFPGIRIHYVENELMKLLKQYITETL